MMTFRSTTMYGPTMMMMIIIIIITLLCVVWDTQAFMTPHPTAPTMSNLVGKRTSTADGRIANTASSSPFDVSKIPSSPTSRASSVSVPLYMAANESGEGSSSTSTSPKDNTNNLPFWLDIGTKGGAVFWSLVLFIVPIIGYNIVTGIFGFDELVAGKWIGVGFTAVAILGWSSTYLFRVATKDMTYAKQLKDYENAVIAKRLEELDDDEIQALVEEIERDEF